MALNDEISSSHLDLGEVDVIDNEEAFLETIGKDKDGEDEQPKPKPGKTGKSAAKDEGAGADEDVDEVDEILNDKKKVKSKKDKSEDGDENRGDDEDLKTKKKDKKSPEDGINIGDEDEDEDEDDETEPESVLHYINKQHKLGLKLENLPEDFGKKEEAEAVSNLISRIVNNANTKISEYRAIQALLKDDEVRIVLEAKKAGKSLRDIASQYVTTADGMSDEAVVRQDFKKKFTWASDQEISDMVQDHVKKGTLQKVANAAREEAKKVGELTTAQEAEKARREREEEEEEYQEIVKEYAGYVSKINKVYGVPITQEMKREAFVFSTARDNKGMSRLDHALQSDEGMLLATLGILHLKKLISKTASSSTNKSRKDVLELLDETPETLQSRRKQSKEGGNKDIAYLANLW